MRRLFIAIKMPEQVGFKLANLQGGIPGARWVDVSQFHLTIHFIGEVDGQREQDLVDSFSGLYANRFNVNLKGINHFSSKGYIRSIWVGVQPCCELFALKRRIESIVTKTDLKGGGGKFVPHVTLARLKNPPSEAVAGFEMENNLFKINSIQIDSFTLFESKSVRQGRSYQTILDFPLK